MNREETLKYLALVKVAYPMAYKDTDRETILATVEMWQRTFSDLPYPLMEMAFDNFRRHSKFPPTVAEIYTELRKIHSTAWQDLNEAAMTEDDDKFSRAIYVMEITERYLLKKDRSAIPYDVLTRAMLAQSNAARILNLSE